MARHSVRVGLALYTAGAAQSAQLYEEAALLRVHKVSAGTDAEKLAGIIQPSCDLLRTFFLSCTPKIAAGLPSCVARASGSTGAGGSGVLCG